MAKSSGSTRTAQSRGYVISTRPDGTYMTKGKVAERIQDAYMAISGSLIARHGSIKSGGGSDVIYFRPNVTKHQINAYMKDAEEGAKLAKNWIKKGRSAKQAWLDWRTKKE